MKAAVLITGVTTQPPQDSKGKAPCLVARTVPVG